MTAAASSSRFRLILISGLGAILLGVLCWPSAEPETADAAASSDRAARRKKATAVSAAPARPTWSSIARAEAREFNPFAKRNPIEISASSDKASSAGSVDEATPATAGNSPSTSQEPAARREVIRVQAVLGRTGQKIALIDGRLVRIGEIIPQRGRVISITQHGVIVETSN